MSTYKDMYYHLLKESEKALNIIINAQKECEELYLEEKKDNFSIFKRD